MPRFIYTGGFAAVQLVNPHTGALLGEVKRGEDIDVPEGVVEHLSAEFKPAADAAPIAKKKEAAR